MSNKFMFFLSTALTAFVLVTLYGVVTKMSSNPGVANAAALATATEEVVVVEATTAPEATVVPEATATPVLNHDLAAMIAAKAINRQDVYSVELKTVNGVQGYEVVFGSNDVVFVDMNRQVVSISALPTAVMYYEPAATATPKKSSSGSGGNGGDDHNEPEHEDND